MAGIDYSINYLTKESRKNIEQLIAAVEKHDKALAKSLKLINDTSKANEDTTKANVQNQKELLKAKEQLTRAEAKEAKQILKVREDVKALNKQNRDSIKLAKAEEIIKNKQVKSIRDLEIVTNALVLKRKNLNLTTKEGLAQYKELNTQIRNNNAALIKSDAAIGRNQRSVGNYAGAIKDAAIGIAALAASILALGRAVTSTTKAFADFETGQTNVQTLLEETNTSLSKDSIKLMLKYGLAVGDVNKALFDAVSAGVDAGGAIDFLDQATILAIGGVTDLASSVDGVTGIINGYGLRLEDTSKITAAFFSAQKFGKTTVAQLTQEIGNVIPIAAKAGISYQELLSTYAIFTKQSIKTTDATTAIKATISALIKPAEEARQEFKRLGISTGIVALKQQGFGETLKQVALAVEKDEDALVKLIPNIRALTGVGALGTRQLKEYDKILKVVSEDYGENSSLAKAYALQQETLNKALDRFKAQVTVLQIELGTKLKPALIFLLDNMANIGKLFVTASTAITSYTLVVNGAAIAKKVYAIAAGIATKATRLFSTAIKANPLGLLVSLLTTAATAFLLFKSDADKATDSQKEFNKELEKTKNLQEDTKSIEDRAKIIEKLNSRQLKALKEEAETQRTIYEDSQAQLDLLIKKREDAQKVLDDSTTKTVDALDLINAQNTKIFTSEKEIEDLKARNSKKEIERLDNIIAETERFIALRTKKDTTEVNTNIEKETQAYTDYYNDRIKLEEDFQKRLTNEKAKLADESDKILDELLLSEIDKIEIAQLEKELKLKEALRKNLISEQEYSEAKIALEKQTAETIAKIDESAVQTKADALQAAKDKILADNAEFLSGLRTSLDVAATTIEDFATGNKDALENLSTTAKNILIGLTKDFIIYVVKQGLVANASEAAAIASAAATGSAIAAAYSSAAALASIASFGAASVAGTAGVLTGLATVKAASQFAEGGDTGTQANRVIMVNDGVGNKREYVIRGEAVEALGVGTLDKLNAVSNKTDAKRFFDNPDNARYISKKRNVTGKYAQGGVVTGTLPTTAIDNTQNLKDINATVAMSNLPIVDAINNLSAKLEPLDAEGAYIAVKKGEESTATRNE